MPKSTRNTPDSLRDDVPDIEDGEDEPAADASGSDNSEAALALLRALARADPEVTTSIIAPRHLSVKAALLQVEYVTSLSGCSVAVARRRPRRSRGVDII